MNKLTLNLVKTWIHGGIFSLVFFWVYLFIWIFSLISVSSVLTMLMFLAFGVLILLPLIGGVLNVVLLRWLWNEEAKYSISRLWLSGVALVALYIFINNLKPIINVSADTMMVMNFTVFAILYGIVGRILVQLKSIIVTEQKR